MNDHGHSAGPYTEVKLVKASFVMKIEVSDGEDPEDAFWKALEGLKADYLDEVSILSIERG